MLGHPHVALQRLSHPEAPSRPESRAAAPRRTLRCHRGTGSTSRGAGGAGGGATGRSGRLVDLSRAQSAQRLCQNGTGCDALEELGASDLDGILGGLTIMKTSKKLMVHSPKMGSSF